MLEESKELLGMSIYTADGLFVGKASAFAVDTDARRIGSIIVEDPNPAVAEKGVILGIPYSWVTAVCDIIVVKKMPGRAGLDGELSPLQIP